jgi:hypothetical protein
MGALLPSRTDRDAGGAGWLTCAVSCVMAAALVWIAYINMNTTQIPTIRIIARMMVLHWLKNTLTY